MDVKIINERLPVIQINFEEMKTALSETLKNYSGIIVTEETLAGCKTTQKELASVRVKIDTYRKDKKKELSEPITVFENQCKELIALIEKAEQPIKDGIKVFDDIKRNDKYKVAENLIKTVIDEQGLNEKYSARLDVSEKYCNLTAKESEVKSDLTARAMTLRVEQDREAELIDIIKDSIETENQNIKTKMAFEDFERLIERGIPTKDILSDIKQRALKIFEAENPKPIEPVVEPAPEIIIEPEKIIESIPETEPTYFGVYRITGSLAQLRAVSKFIKDNDISYKVLEQGEM